MVTKPPICLFLATIIASQQGLVSAFVVDTSDASHPRLANTLLEAKRVPRSAAIDTSSSTGPKGPRSSARQRQRRSTPPKRAPHQFDHTKEEPRPFVDALAEIASQDSNEDAPLYELPDSTGKDIVHDHITTYSLDDLFLHFNFSTTFATSTTFREELRNSMREDIFDTTPTYHGMSEKARNVLLLPDSSLQGSWKCHQGGWSRTLSNSSDDQDNEQQQAQSLPRMQRLTTVLKKHLGENAPTGDEFMDTIGSLCGNKPSTHWIDIVGVLTRRVPHSWHQDTGNSPDDSKTVLLGFPPSDNYEGVGVFSHVVKLKKEQWASEEHSPMEPVLYRQEIGDEYIVRPRYAKGRELIVYRDVDVLHSSPDVAHRASVMRFM